MDISRWSYDERLSNTNYQWGWAAQSLSGNRARTRFQPRHPESRDGEFTKNLADSKLSGFATATEPHTAKDGWLSMLSGNAAGFLPETQIAELEASEEAISAVNRGGSRLLLLLEAVSEQQAFWKHASQVQYPS